MHGSLPLDSLVMERVFFYYFNAQWPVNYCKWPIKMEIWPVTLSWKMKAAVTDREKKPAKMQACHI